MTKGLEALEIILEKYSNDETIIFNTYIIEKELKRLEEIETMYSNCVIKGAKQKKALDIIKEKKVNCYLFINSENLKDYNWCVDDITEKRLIQDEYDLLKEVLKDEE